MIIKLSVKTRTLSPLFFTYCMCPCSPIFTPIFSSPSIRILSVSVPSKISIRSLQKLMTKKIWSSSPTTSIIKSTTSSSCEIIADSATAPVWWLKWNVALPPPMSGRSFRAQSVFKPARAPSPFSRRSATGASASARTPCAAAHLCLGPFTTWSKTDS